jgi:hypothetical protein
VPHLSLRGGLLLQGDKPEEQQRRLRARLGDEGEAAPAVLTPVVLVVWALRARDAGGIAVVAARGLAYRSGLDGLLSAAEIW